MTKTRVTQPAGTKHKHVYRQNGYCKCGTPNRVTAARNRVAEAQRQDMINTGVTQVTIYDEADLPKRANAFRPAYAIVEFDSEVFGSGMVRLFTVHAKSYDEAESYLMGAIRDLFLQSIPVGTMTAICWFNGTRYVETAYKVLDRK